MVVIHLRSGRDLKVPNAQGMALRKGRLVCLDSAGRAIQTLDPAEVESFSTTADPSDVAASPRREGGLNLLGRLRIKKAEPGLPPERVDRLKERVRLQSDALAGNAALEFMEEDNREMRLTEWAKPIAAETGDDADADAEADTTQAGDEIVPMEKKDVDYLVSLLQEEYDDKDGAARDS